MFQRLLGFFRAADGRPSSARLAAAAGVGVGAVVLVWLFARSGAREPHALTCRFTVGEPLAYSLHLTAESWVADVSRGKHALDGTLVLKAIEKPAPTEWILVGRIEVRPGGLQDDPPAYRSVEKTPFALRVGSDCRFADFGFAPESDPDTRSEIIGLLKNIEVRLGADATAREWARSQDDSAGAYMVRYARSGDEDGHPIVQKTRGSYLKPTAGDAPSLTGTVEAASATAVLDAGGAWLRRYTGAEKLRFSGEGLQIAVKSSTKLERLETAPPFPLSEAEARADRFTFGEKVKPATQVRREADATGLEAMSLDVALEDFRKRLSPGNGAALYRATGFLKAYLTVHPEAAKQLLAQIKKGGFPSRTAGDLILAMERTGTPEVQAALAGALRDREMSALDRARAASALGDIPRSASRPIVDAAVDTLSDIAKAAPGSQDEARVTSAALIALGSLANDVAKTQPEVAQRVAAGLTERMGAAQSYEDRTRVLAGVGNTGDESLIGLLVEQSRSEDPRLRAAAAAAFRLMDPAARDPLLSEWYEREPVPEVRIPIVVSLATPPDIRAAFRVSDAVIAKAAVWLPLEPAPPVRMALIELLGPAASTSPIAKSALVRQFHTETLTELLTAIGRFVGAADLR